MKTPLLAALSLLIVPSIAQAQAELTGDTKLACEAVLCLSTSSRPAECSPSLSRYFGIRHKKFSDTLKARLNFLNMCPASSQTVEMATLVSAITVGAGRCDAASLNDTLLIWMHFNDSGQIFISDQLPDYCAAYSGHAYTDFNSSGNMPRYVGEPLRGGHWVEERNYQQALAYYTERIRLEDEARLQGSW